MKALCKYIHLSLFLSSIFYFQNVYCQGYFNNNPVWRIESVCAENSPACLSHNDYNYFFNGDTLIDGHLYYKLFKYGHGYYTWNDPPPIPPYCIGSFIIGSLTVPFNYIRDSLGLIYLYNNPELCIYDFNLMIGDTLPMCYGNSDQIVLSIDSMIIDHYIRRIFHLSNSGGQSTEIIEGVGHTYGFLEQLPPILECSNTLECFSVNDTSYYPSTGLQCNSTTSVREFEDARIDLFPNPMHSILNVTCHNKQINFITIIDTFGRVVYSSRVNSNIHGSITLNFSNENFGFYNMIIRTTDQRVYSKRFLLQ